VILSPAKSPLRRDWRMIARVEPISAAQVRNACVIGLTAGLLFCVLACVVIDRLGLDFSL